MKRPDFLYDCECGYYVCPECGTPWYPVEVMDTAFSEEPPGTHRCPECLMLLGKKEGGKCAETKE